MAHGSWQIPIAARGDAANDSIALGYANPTLGPSSATVASSFACRRPVITTVAPASTSTRAISLTPL